MKKALLKISLMAFMCAGIIAATNVDVRCEGDITYYSSSETEEMDRAIEEELNALGFTRKPPTGQSTTSSNSQNNEPEKREQVKACEHLYVDTIIKEPTCAEDGELQSKCSKCGDTRKTIIAATGKHDYSSEVTKEATCIEIGEMTYTCTVCGDTYTEEIPVIDHNYEAAVTKEATCTEAGVKTYICTMCNDSYTEEIAAVGHHPADAVITKEAGLFTTGEEVIKCDTCEEVLETNVIPSKYPLYYLYVVIAVIGALVMGGFLFFMGKKKKKIKVLQKAA